VEHFYQSVPANAYPQSLMLYKEMMQTNSFGSLKYANDNNNYNSVVIIIIIIINYNSSSSSNSCSSNIRN